MKKILYKTSGLLLMYILVLFSACTDVIVDNSEGGEVVGDGREIPIALDINNLFNPDINTYGTLYPGTLVPGNAAENAVNDVVVYVFDNMFVCEKIIVQPAPVPSPIGPVMVKSGMKHFVAVVNGDGKIALEKTTPSNVSYTALLNAVTNTNPALPVSPFLMTGIKNFVALPSEIPASSPHPVALEITRACAKVTMQITKSAQAAGHSIKLKSITMYRGADRVPLFSTSTLASTQQHIISTTKNAFDPDNNVLNLPTYIMMHDTIYTYENLCGPDTTKAIRFEILAEVNSPTNERTAKFYLATYERGPNDSIYNVYRNHWYDVKVNIVDPGMDSIYVDIKACPWNVADTITPPPPGQGAEFTSALPLKLVQNFTADVLTDPAKSKYAAINKHSKGASWIDVKALNNTSWELILADPSVPRNIGVLASIDGGATWQDMALYPPGGSGDGTTIQRVYIYRPYRENDEPSLGPTIYATVGGQYKEGFVIQPRDTVPIPTNCYVMRPPLSGPPDNETHAYIPLAGVYNVWENYLLDTLAGRICDTIPFGSITANIQWQDNPSVVKNLSVIHPSKRDSAYIFVEAGAPGNAVVNMTVGGTIYWSFHLWVTEYNPYEAAGQKIGITKDQYLLTILHKNVFMDRNLGALGNAFDVAGTAHGLYYQYGRKDPFRRDLPSHPSASQTTAASSLFRPLPVMQATIKNPTTFYTRGSNDYSLVIENRNIWNTPGDNKTPFDPCPEGWRIPIQHQLYISPFVGSINAYYKPDLVNGYGSINDTMGYFPHSGCIKNAVRDSVGTNTFIWSSVTSVSEPNTGNGLYIKYTTPPYLYICGSGITEFDKSFGASVRCVVDKNYIFRKTNGGLFGSEVNRLRGVLLP